MSKPVTFLVSDESINSYKCRVLSEGGDTNAFESNPVMLYMHQRGNVIGKWENLTLKDGKWYADPVFDTEDNDLGKSVGGKVERGFLKAASLGICFDFADVIYNELLDCYDITKWAFQEISIVDIGSNTNALQLYDKAGEPLDELKLAAHLEQFKGPVEPTKTTTHTTDKPMELKTIALALGLPETATEQEVLTFAASAKDYNATAAELASLKLQMASRLTGEASELVEQAVSDKRIPATAKDSYLKLFAADHDSAKTILAALPKPQNLLQLASQGASESAAVSVMAKADKIKKYDELEKGDGLLKLAQTDFATFSSLFEAKFDCKPDKISV